jgi:DNA end-binding protein Ku
MTNATSKVPRSRAAAASGKWQSNRTASNDTTSDGGGRALWRGTLSFGLVQIPVRLAAVESANELSFHQLDRHDNSPVGYERVNKVTGKKVAWGDIVKGYEISKGTFIIVTDDDFKKANIAASQTIDIEEFVDGSAIVPAYFERPYHLQPDARGSKAYAVLRDAMARKNLVAIARVVIRTRQHLCAVMAQGDYLELELLRFAHELRAPSGGPVTAKASEQETKMADMLLESMVGPWQPEKYKDTYRDDLLAAIQEKAQTGAVEPRNAPAKGPPATTDLLALLQQSVRGAGAGGPSGARKAGTEAKPRAKKPRSAA